MTDFADRSTATARASVLPLVAIAANLVAISTVMFWIYHARAMFTALHPDYVAVEPATISRAISDPLIGEPFHLWVSLSGLLLIFGVGCIGVFYDRLRKLDLQPSRYLAGVLWIGVPGIVALQATAALGMFLLSGYRFPHFHETHMVGSYLFFIAQTLVVLTGTLMCDALQRDKPTMEYLRNAGLVRTGMVRLRKLFGVFCMMLTVVYVFLFMGKGMDFGAANDALYLAYTSVEPLLITCFLLYLALHQTDLLALRRLQRRS